MYYYKISELFLRQLLMTSSDITRVRLMTLCVCVYMYVRGGGVCAYMCVWMHECMYELYLYILDNEIRDVHYSKSHTISYTHHFYCRL